MLRFTCLVTLVCLTGCPTPQAVDAGVKFDAGRPKVDAGPVLPTEFSITVEVKGLEGRGMILRVNGINDLPVTTSGIYTFPQKLDTMEVYTVTVGVQPSAPTQLCTVENGIGTIASADITDVVVKCVTHRYNIGGTVVGLTGLGLTLRNNNADALSITKNGAFVFPITFAPNAGYDVTILNQPVGPTQTCTVNGGTGIVGNSDVQSVVINCSSSAFTIGGTVSGLAGSVTVRNNGTDTLTLTANGTFAFGVPIESNNSYSVEVVTQPGPNSSCYVDQGIGVVGVAPVTTVRIVCSTAAHFIGGTLTNLGFNSVILTNNGGNHLTLTANGTFRFTNPVSSGSTYDVKVSGQPATQRCAVNRGTGTVDAIDITTVEVNCANTFAFGGQLIGSTGPVTLRNNGEDLVVPGNGIFTFQKRYLPNETWALSVVSQPSDGLTFCTVEYPTGTFTTGPVSINVKCTGLGTSCDDILADHPGAGSGYYFIDPDDSGPLQPMQVTCDMLGDNGGWMRVTPEFIESIDHANKVTVIPTLDTFGGATITYKAFGQSSMSDNCGVDSYGIVFLEDIVPWSKVRATWDFEGNAYCFSIFGNELELGEPSNLVPFSINNDVIRKQIRMGDHGADNFDGLNYRCTDSFFNFWSNQNGQTKRSAEVILRRADLAKPAGIGVGARCGIYNDDATTIATWRFSNIWIR